MARKYISSSDSGPAAVRLRPATAGDVEFVRQLSAEVFTQFGDYGAFLPGYIGHPSVLTTIADRNGKPAGFIMVALVFSSRHVSGQAERTGPSEATPAATWLDAEVVAIAVSPGEQGQGVGKRLMQAAIDLAETWPIRAGVRSVQLNVADTNERARRFFELMGFSVIEPDDGTYPRGQRSIRLARLTRGWRAAPG